MSEPVCSAACGAPGFQWRPLPCGGAADSSSVTGVAWQRPRGSCLTLAGPEPVLKSRPVAGIHEDDARRLPGRTTLPAEQLKSCGGGASAVHAPDHTRPVIRCNDGLWPSSVCRTSQAFNSDGEHELVAEGSGRRGAATARAEALEGALRGIAREAAGRAAHRRTTRHCRTAAENEVRLAARFLAPGSA